MRLLLDTNAFLWWRNEAPQLAARVIAAIGDPENEIVVSIVSLWEIAIKAAKGQFVIDLDILSAAVDQAALRELPVKRQHIRTLRTLSFHHHDPFDRMLIAQAVTEPLHLLTSDEKLKLYSDLVVLV